MPDSLRFPAELSRGRRHPEAAHPFRGPFERDRDRIIHSRAFRRLEHKTQVVTSPDSDHFRNRLTHTLEVAQVSRSVAAALDLNEDLVEALALAHDLGHTAFGHAGEEALDEEMREYGDRFDHNRHALRIVEDFEQRYAAFRGLNLTFEVREGLIKHSSELDPAEAAVREYQPELRPLLEAQLIDPCDEIAYNCADLDDAIDAGFIPVETACRRVEPFAEFYEDASTRFPDATRRQTISDSLRRLLGWCVAGLIEGTKATLADSDANTHDAVRRLPHRVALLSPEAAEVSRQLKDLLHADFYQSLPVSTEAGRAADKLRELFRHFVRHPDSLPQSYLLQSRQAPIERVVCDYVAGMTDKFLLSRHEALVGGRS